MGREPLGHICHRLRFVQAIVSGHCKELLRAALGISAPLERPASLDRLVDPSDTRPGEAAVYGLVGQHHYHTAMPPIERSEAVGCINPRETRLH